VDINDPTSLFSDHSIQGESPRTYGTANRLNSLGLTTEPPVDEPTPSLSPTVSVKTFTTDIDNVAKKSIRAHAEKRAKIIQELSARLTHSSMQFSIYFSLNL
jgi:hypothetical protein